MSDTTGFPDRLPRRNGSDSTNGADSHNGHAARDDAPDGRPHNAVPHTAVDTRAVPDERLPGLDDTEQQCWEYFLDSSARMFDLLQRELSHRHNLALFDVLLLSALARSEDGSARMGDLADALVLTPSRLTEQTRRLQAKGMVTRTVSPDDRRGVLATITTAGRIRLQSAMTTYARIVRRHYLDPLTRQQMTATGDSCRRISDELHRDH
jgi:DNA-binding MarR family transcriptional regulator